MPIAVGEQFGDRWDLNELVEQGLIDHARITVPNVGGITEFLKIANMCETHYVGLCLHFTGPISEAALVHVCGAFSGPVLMEMTGDSSRQFPHLKQVYDFRNGKMWPNRRPGLSVEVNTIKLQQIADITERYTATPTLRRPDGSYTRC